MTTTMLPTLLALSSVAKKGFSVPAQFIHRSRGIIFVTSSSVKQNQRSLPGQVFALTVSCTGPVNPFLWAQHLVFGVRGRRWHRPSEALVLDQH